jgi:DNA replication protein DnaC
VSLNALEAAGMGAVMYGPPHLKPMAQQATFARRYGECKEHGKYPLNGIDDAGVYFAYPEWCPACKRQELASSAIAGSNIPERFLSCTFDNYMVSNDGQQVALTMARRYAENFAEHRKTGCSLILTGTVGTGKNHLATAVAKVLLAQHFTVLRVKAAHYLDAFWAKDFSEREAWISELSRIDLLMLDEVGRSSQAKAAQDAFFRLIDGRYELGRPMLITTNLMRRADVDELAEALGEAAYDRVRQGGTERARMEWESYRKNAD